MKIPLYIEKALIKRAKYAGAFTEADYVVSNWLDKHGIEIDTADYWSGAEALCNPWDSANRIAEAIAKKGEE